MRLKYLSFIIYHLSFSVALVSLCVACSSPQVPESYTESNKLPKIYPDYIGVTVPVNMAPLHFQLMPVADEADVVTRFKCGDEEIVCDGRKAMPEISDWQRLVAVGTQKSAPITVEVFENKADGWVRYKPFNITISPDSIDSWFSYRLISPSYVAFEELTINQRNLESFDERVIYNNMLCSEEAEGQCINCHNYQQWNPNRMQFHARLNHGGTLINYDGQLRKVNLKTDSTISAGVYPAWHPTLPFIAYSTDKTHQMFHTHDINKVEVFDTQSDLILYDLERNEVLNVENSTDEFEVFPAWSPDGQWLYYCSAHFEKDDTTAMEEQIIRRYKEIRYNVYRKSFDAQSRTFGERELVFDAASRGLSATLPRISPDGRWLMLSVGGWGCFHIWHRDADLWIAELDAQRARPWKEVNSSHTEAYHTWSSNGRWIVFSSRRDDGNFTRPFFAHVDKAGNATKPFELPTDDPDYHRQLLKSYNIPELMRGPVTITPQSFADALKGEAQPATFIK